MSEHALPAAAGSGAARAVTLSARDAGHYPVIVVGGGLAGFCAAIASARNGARTLLAESMPYLGGNGVTGIPLSSFRATNSPRLVVAGLPLEILRRLRRRGGFSAQPQEREMDWLSIDCEALQIEMTHMLDEVGVELLTHAPLLAAEREERRVSALVFHSKDHLLRYTADLVIDATGDAQVAHLAGLPTSVGRQRDGKTQPMTLTFTLGGVDPARVPRWSEVQARWLALRRERPGGWRNPRDGISDPFFVPGKPGVCSFNVTRVLVEKGTDSRLLAQAEKEGRYQVEEFVEQFLRPHIAGYEHCHLVQLGARIGVRETRRIRGLYELQRDDLLTLRAFPDAIACNSYPVDIHSPDGGGTQHEVGSLPDDSHYTIPFGCLVAADADNLLAAGRCVSASHEALSAVRVLSAAMATGQAAGTAVALCARHALPPGRLDSGLLRKTLREQGALVG